jgi:transposase
MLLADRGYDADWIRALAAEKGAWANIPPRRNRTEPICFIRRQDGSAIVTKVLYIEHDDDNLYAS